ncbi:MAG: plasmid pRiA4b ORF-3 family protein [Caulobacteraceae bacterium]|nr:plasmid pRiA4b ORF-3 family protein [Caulobacteraceae bacterium]
MPTPSAAVLKITLDDVEPTVMRRVVVPADIRLDRLHLIIQAAMGWTNSHLYEFRIGGAGWGEPDPDGLYDGPLDAKKPA